MKHLPLQIAALVFAIVGTTAQAAECREGFEHVSTLQSRGWLMQNNSEPLGTTGWFQGKPGIFPAYSGATNSYVSADRDSTTSSNFSVLSNWLITPEIDFTPDATFGFYTRALPDAADQIVVSLCVVGGSTTCAAPTAPPPHSGYLGGFYTALVDINPGQDEDGYPSTWTHYQITPMDGLPTSGRGRIAFHYYGFGVEFGSTIGIDEVTVAGTSGCPLTEVVFADGFDD